MQHNLGTVFYLERDYAGAVPYLERSVALEPTDSFTRYLLADCYHELGRKDDARREVETSLRYKPGFKAALFTLETGNFVKW